MKSLEYYDSTEIYQNGQWTEAAKLPWAVTGLRGMTLDNSVIMTGWCYLIWLDLNVYF